MSTGHVYVLHAGLGDGREIRHAVHLCEDAETLMAAIMLFIAVAERPEPSVMNMAALASGPNHPGFPAALEALRLNWSKGCHDAVVDRTIEMLIACSMLPPIAVEDDSINVALYASFSTEADWEHFERSAQMVALTLLVHHGVVEHEEPEKQTRQERDIIIQLASAVCVAVIQARAEYQRELTAEAAS